MGTWRRKWFGGGRSPDTLADFSPVDVPDWTVKPPYPPPHGHKPFQIWWD